MSDQRPERRRFQFGLRKLLLWTAAIALLLGIAVALGDLVWTLAACWIIVVGGIRVATSPVVAAIASVGAGVVLGAWIGAETSPSLATYRMIEYCISGCLVGFLLLCIAEVVSRAVDTAEDRMRTKTDD